MKKAVQDEAIQDKRGLYESFLTHFEAKLNPVSLVQIVTYIVKAELHSSPTDAVEFLKPLCPPEEEEDKSTKIEAENTTTTTTSSTSFSTAKRSPLSENPEARILLDSLMSSLYMAAGNRAAAKKCIESARSIVDEDQGTSYDLQPAVHSAFYEAAASYHKVVGTASGFFRNALQFLAYTPPETLAEDVQLRWAFDIGIAALVGTDVYNFGEVVSRAIVQSLRSTEHEWLLLVLEAFNHGDLDKYEKVCKESASKMNAQQVLVTQQDFLKQKITILALLQLAFSRSLQHSISFEDVEKACKLPIDEVEHLLMRCMSLGLISGIIDDVDQTVSISRVQPRVLDREPIGVMAARLKAWCSNVDEIVLQLRKTDFAINK